MNANMTAYAIENEQFEAQPSDLKSKNLSCVDCQNPFIFSTGEQEFYRNRGFLHEPKRCPNCRTSKRLRNSDKPVVATEITCVECGIRTTVPFLPRNANHVYCATCFKIRGYQKIAQ
jgi:CxxC-x17-CxxC domain-containing protein